MITGGSVGLVWRQRVLCLLLLGAAVACALALPAASALGASPAKWGVTMTHFNPYGAAAKECEHHIEEPLVEPPCGVDPFSLSGESFARESGYNTYKITVENTGGEVAGSAHKVGD